MSEGRSTGAQVADVLSARRAAIGAAIFEGRASSHPKLNRYGDSPAQLRTRIDEWLSLLIGFFQGHPGYGPLLAGQTLLEFNWPERSPEENHAIICDGIADARAELAAETQGAFDAAQQSAFFAGLDEVFAGLTRKSDRHVRTLLIGDCLVSEIAGLATDATARKGVSFDPFPVNARDARQLGRSIDGFGHAKYDAVFFSPFSHSRSSELEQLLRPALALRGSTAIHELVDRIIEQTRELLLHLSGRFECPIYVHDAGLVPRASTKLKATVLDVLTARQRAIAGKRLNAWLRGMVETINADGARRVQIIEETAVVKKLGLVQAGQFLHHSASQHATALSLSLAHEYAQRIEMLGLLHGRKLVVCDLDNTLWRGTIGDGAVEHYTERQAALLRLKRNSGVVLSIASKNDPEKVHFRGGLLAEGDFVAPQISWGFKANAIQAIREAINIQQRHMVFVDDRADERALVSELHPDVLALDAEDPAVWQRLSLWADLVEGSSDLDRTKLYQEQAARDAFTGTGGEVATADADMLARLGLTIEVRVAEKGDLKRVAELINRTNQWNMCGSRTSLAELSGLASVGKGLVLLARVSDRFGDMGDVCAAVVTLDGDEASIPIFVLSCRVFGYGVETAMLDEIKRRVGLGERVVRLHGRYIATNQNHLARAMYSEHGFSKLADGFVLEAKEPALKVG